MPDSSMSKSRRRPPARRLYRLSYMAAWLCWGDRRLAMIEAGRLQLNLFDIVPPFIIIGDGMSQRGGIAEMSGRPKFQAPIDGRESAPAIVARREMIFGIAIACRPLLLAKMKSASNAAPIF